MLEELGGDDGADEVRSHAVGVRPAAAVAEEPGHRVHAARFQRPAEHVALAHGSSIARPAECVKVSSNSMTSSRTLAGGLPLSLLDLAQIPEGGTARTALHRSRELAQHAEALGFRRFWLAEHHNMAGIASAATSGAIRFVAEGTSTIRVGAGGIMLPNHAPLVIAEQFGTLEALYPGRIDLGLGRAPGTDQLTMRALRRD